MPSLSLTTLLVVAVALSCTCAGLAAAAAPAHPVILFPGYSLSVFEVTVTNQTVQPACPASGTYRLHYHADPVQDGFDITCMTNLLALNYSAETGRFSGQPGVDVALKDYGHPACAPFFEDFFVAMEGAGLVRNTTLLAACFDWRMAPNVDVIPGTNFMADTRDLVLRAYEAANRTKVYLVGHSNGPIVAQYFLLHAGASFREKYIAGFIPYAGNWAGGGLMTSLLYEGLNVLDFTFLPSTAATYEAWPSTYFSAAQPETFKRAITIIRTPERNYTPEDYTQLWTDSGFDLAAVLNPKYNGLVKPTMFPEVPVHNFFGSNISTIVGSVRANLSIGHSAIDYLYAMGDINQEYITNESNEIWSQMRCDSFTNRDLRNVDHFELPNHPAVLNATVAIITAPTPGDLCSGTAGQLLANNSWLGFLFA